MTREQRQWVAARRGDGETGDAALVGAHHPLHEHGGRLGLSASPRARRIGPDVRREHRAPHHRHLRPDVFGRDEQEAPELPRKRVFGPVLLHRRRADGDADFVTLAQPFKRPLQLILDVRVRVKVFEGGAVAVG